MSTAMTDLLPLYSLSTHKNSRTYSHILLLLAVWLLLAKEYICETENYNSFACARTAVTSYYTSWKGRARLGCVMSHRPYMQKGVTAHSET